MKHLISVSMVLVLSACAIQQPGPIEVDTGKFPLDTEAADTSTFRWYGAWDHYSNRYSKLQYHKAFAQSRSGIWGWYTGLTSAESAMQAALDDCRQYNAEYEATEPCRIVNVNGYWGAELPSGAPSNERKKLNASEFFGDNPDLQAPIHYDYFKPMGTTHDEVHRLEGRLVVPAFYARKRAPWITDGSFSNIVFPEFEIHLTTSGDVLLPLERDQLIWSANDNGAVIVSPGKVWRESGEGDWSRGSFPITYIDPRDYAPHYGVATFLFNDQTMSEVRLQFSQETANWARFDIWGQTKVSYVAGPIDKAQKARDAYAIKTESQLKIRPWHELEARFSQSLEDFDGAGNRENITLSGLLVDDVFYLRPCRTRAGPHPYCENMRHGVYSITKSLAAAVSMLWLAGKYGAEVFDEKIADYVTIPAQHDGWNEVTFGNALDMTTGIGNLVPEPVEHYVEVDDSPIATQVRNVRSLGEKLDAVANFENYPWGPAEVFRYRSSDTFVLAVAMEAFLRNKEGPEADLWESVTREVLVPLGIDRLPILRTIEADGRPGTPLMSTGLYPTFEEVIKLSRLLQNHGEFDNKQLLHRGLTGHTVSSDMNRGFANGWVNRQGGKGHYEKGFWLSPQNWAGCNLRTTGMAGFGGNYVIIMPNRTIGIRFADGYDDDPYTWDSYGIRSVSHRLRPFC